MVRSYRIEAAAGTEREMLRRNPVVAVFLSAGNTTCSIRLKACGEQPGYSAAAAPESFQLKGVIAVQEGFLASWCATAAIRYGGSDIERVGLGWRGIGLGEGLDSRLGGGRTLRAIRCGCRRGTRRKRAAARRRCNARECPGDTTVTEIVLYESAEFDARSRAQDRRDLGNGYGYGRRCSDRESIRIGFGRIGCRSRSKRRLIEWRRGHGRRRVVSDAFRARCTQGPAGARRAIRAIGCQFPGCARITRKIVLHIGSDKDVGTPGKNVRKLALDRHDDTGRIDREAIGVRFRSIVHRGRCECRLVCRHGRRRSVSDA